MGLPTSLTLHRYNSYNSVRVTWAKISPQLQDSLLSTMNKQHMSCESPLAWKCLFALTFFGGQFWPMKWVRLAWFVACDQGSLVGLWIQDYKCAVITICSTLINIRTHTDSIWTSLYKQLSWFSYKVCMLTKLKHDINNQTMKTRVTFFIILWTTLMIKSQPNTIHITERLSTIIICTFCECLCVCMPLNRWYYTGFARLWNDLLCVEWDVKPYTLTHTGLSASAHLALHILQFQGRTLMIQS